LLIDNTKLTIEKERYGNGYPTYEVLVAKINGFTFDNSDEIEYYTYQLETRELREVVWAKRNEIYTKFYNRIKEIYPQYISQVSPYY